MDPELLTWTADATPIDPVAGLVGGEDGGAVLRYGHRAGRKDADRKRNWVRLFWSEAGAVCDLGFCA